MTFKIDQFTETMRFGGARPHLFQVEMSLPPALTSFPGAVFSADIVVKASATQIPASTVDAIPVFYQGRAVNFSGNRTYAPWAIEVINDEDFGVYDAFISWLSALNEPIDNVRNSGFSSRPEAYKSQATIQQFGQDEARIKTWKCTGLFPVNVSEITLGWQDTNQIERFQVTFAVDAVIPQATFRV
jgi:hypothetical protein